VTIRPLVGDPDEIGRALRAAGLGAWAACAPAQLRRFYVESPHGDWPEWRRALASLPAVGPGTLSCLDGALTVSPQRPLAPDERQRLSEALSLLHPWRKGPYTLAGVPIDSEWRSDWKWDRLVPALEPLEGRLVLDVGCGNGYHCWRTALAGARSVIGIDPTAVYLAQFHAVRWLVAEVSPDAVNRVLVLPVGIEDMPAELRRFDTVFSMGVLYHRRSPIDHLLDLRGSLRPGGQLVLETLVLDAEDDRVLVPPGRYAKMRNVWFIPAPGLLVNWLRRSGFRDVTVVDMTPTTPAEQRATPWMRFESLADFLDPADPARTLEGHPAPVRAIVTASA
jgi:tRNA (mo5U34)-methyltransferase